MKRSLAVLWTICLGASTALLIHHSAGAVSARNAAARARLELGAVSAQAAELVQLRRGIQDFPERPEGSLSTKVSAALSRAGLASSTLQSLSPEAQSPISGDGGIKLLRQRATLTLQNLSLPQLGKFLDAWRTAEPDWVVSSIDLSPITARDTAAIGTDLPLRAVLTIEGLFRQPPRDRGVSR